MRIHKKLSQHRRDFTADYICEHCGHIEKNASGYDDHYFHNHVIPNMPCQMCGKKAPDDYQAQPTKYPEGVQV